MNLGRTRVGSLKTPLVQRFMAGEPMLDSLFTLRAMEQSWLGGDAEAGMLPAEQVAGVIDDIPTVAEVTEGMVA
jgi:hypothetical protein